MYLHAESVKVDTDEGALTLEIESSEEDRITVNIHGIDLDAFYDSVRSGIGGYLRERDEARAQAPDGVVVAIREDGSFRCDPDESGGYDTSDPKHPEFHSIHADIHDLRGF